MSDNPDNRDLRKSTGGGPERIPPSVEQYRNRFYRFNRINPNKSDRGNEDDQKEHKPLLTTEEWKRIWDWGVRVKEHDEKLAKREQELAKREKKLAKREKKLAKREQTFQENLYFEDLKQQTQSAINSINNHKEVFQELGYNIKQLNQMHLEINSLKDAISREPDNTEHKNLFQENFRAIVEMADDLNDFLSIDHDLEDKRDKGRKERIKRSLEELPRNKDDRPILSDLPRKQQWKMYVGAPMHKKAQQISDPGLFLDLHKGPEYQGYKQSMMKLFDNVLVPAQNSGQKDMNYDDLTRMYDLATEFLPNDQRDQMRRMGGIDEASNAYTRYFIAKEENTEMLYERFRLFQELQKDHFCGLPLFQNWPSEQKYIEQIVNDIRESPSKAITVGWVRHDYKPTALEPSLQSYAAEPGNTIMIPSYRKSEGPRYVNSILSAYYQGREKSGQTEYDRLTEIARTIRALFIMHPKYDGNGRTIMFGLMNKFLIEEGFSPTILPNANKVNLTLDGLVEDMLIGMHSFMRAVKENKETSVNA